MSVLDLFRKPRIVRAELESAPVAIAGGRTAVRLVIEGAGVLVVGDARLRFWNGFDGVVRARVADQVGAPIAVRVTSLAGTVERAIAFVPLPAIPAAPGAIRPRDFATPRAPRVTVRLPSFSVHPRGTK